mmetsp:Transcript_38637/g.56799  ORF Transcript_38637/g.56799 Transcript_38637/m.56799 type:complete len:87 (+) Transcript_38637:726-986(+)
MWHRMEFTDRTLFHYIRNDLLVTPCTHLVWSAREYVQRQVIETMIMEVSEKDGATENEHHFANRTFGVLMEVIQALIIHHIRDDKL